MQKRQEDSVRVYQYLAQKVNLPWNFYIVLCIPKHLLNWFPESTESRFK